MAGLVAALKQHLRRGRGAPSPHGDFKATEHARRHRRGHGAVACTGWRRISAEQRRQACTRAKPRIGGRAETDRWATARAPSITDDGDQGSSGRRRAAPAGLRAAQHGRAEWGAASSRGTESGWLRRPGGTDTTLLGVRVPLSPRTRRSPDHARSTLRTLEMTNWGQGEGSRASHASTL
jgi:hypothetical protein